MQQVGFISILVLNVKLIVVGSAALQAGQIFLGTFDYISPHSMVMLSESWKLVSWLVLAVIDKKWFFGTKTFEFRSEN